MHCLAFAPDNHYQTIALATNDDLYQTSVVHIVISYPSPPPPPPPPPHPRARTWSIIIGVGSGGGGARGRLAPPKFQVGGGGGGGGASPPPPQLYPLFT